MKETVLRDQYYLLEPVYAQLDSNGLLTLEGHDEECVVISPKQLELLLEWLEEVEAQEELEKLAEWKNLSKRTA